MAQAKSAKLIGAERLGPHARLLKFSLEDGELGFLGGQYIIVNTGIELGGGKLAKRAYSILSSDSEQHQFQLAVRRIGSGPGSNFMHRIEVGAELMFSGPWGKFGSNGTPPAPRLVFATDTGITATLGLLRAHGSASLTEQTKVFWLVASDDYFLPPAFARGALAGLCENLTIITAPTTADTKLARAVELLDSELHSSVPSSAFLAGDGAVIHGLRDHLMAAGVPSENIHREAFFNNPERKAPS